MARSRLRDDLVRLLDDAGLSAAEAARASGLAPGFVARIVAGDAGGSLETYARLAAALGADLVARLYPNTGPPIRDRHQARMLEVLLGELHPRWQAHAEVIVGRPARGVIDAVLVDRRASLVIAVEVHSELRRLEQLVRWSNEKALSLPSWSRWSAVFGPEAEPAISSLLLVRRTRTNVEVAGAFGRQLALAFPAHPADAVASLSSDRPWPGAAMVWARFDAGAVRLMTVR